MIGRPTTKKLLPCLMAALVLPPAFDHLKMHPQAVCPGSRSKNPGLIPDGSALLLQQKPPPHPSPPALAKRARSNTKFSKLASLAVLVNTVTPTIKGRATPKALACVLSGMDCGLKHFFAAGGMHCQHKKRGKARIIVGLKHLNPPHF